LERGLLEPELVTEQARPVLVGPEPILERGDLGKQPLERLLGRVDLGSQAPRALLAGADLPGQAQDLLGALALALEQPRVLGVDRLQDLLDPRQLRLARRLIATALDRSGPRRG